MLCGTLLSQAAAAQAPIGSALAWYAGSALGACDIIIYKVELRPDGFEPIASAIDARAAAICESDTPCTAAA